MEVVNALALLEKCQGDEIWSIEFCTKNRVPQTWIDRFADSFESGFDTDLNTIYVDNPSENGEKITNQYYGVLDVDIAFEIARFLGIPTNPIREQTLGRKQQVAKIKEAVEEDLV